MSIHAVFSFLLTLSLISATLAGVVSIPLWKQPLSPADLINRDIHQRATVLEHLYGNRQRSSYFVNITLGTPGQPVSVVFDTGSSDLWVLAANANVCIDPTIQPESLVGDKGCIRGTYDHTKSSTYDNLIPNGFQIQYVDESFSRGDYISDTVTFNTGSNSNKPVSKLQVGLAYKSTIPFGIMGVGYNTSLASEEIYSNIIDLMVQQGLINTRAFSLWLDDLASATGQVLFGGIDTAKFSGPLSILPLQAPRGMKPNSFTVAMTGLSAGTPGHMTSLTSTDFAIPVLLDSGTTHTYLPSSVYQAVVNGLDAIDETFQTGAIFVDCGLREMNPDFVLAFRFGSATGPVINVPLTELILDFVDIDQSLFSNVPPRWEAVCYLAISDGDQVNSPIYLLGDSFLRSAYVVYDIDNDELAIAQTNFDSGTNSIVEIMSGAKIPSATGQPDYVSVTPTATGRPGIGLGAVPSNAAKTTGGGSATTDTGGAPASSSNAAVAGLQLPAKRSMAIVMAVWLIFAVFGGLLIVQ